MKTCIAADSSANLAPLPGTEINSVALKILAGDREYVDDAALDAYEMIKNLAAYKGKSGTACPSIEDWKTAFGGADRVFGVTITSSLSGCYNAAQVAAAQYEAENPGAQVFILDSLSTGPEMQLIVEKYQELIARGLSFEEIREEIEAYHRHTHLVFSLTSLNNFARNGRIKPALAMAMGVLGICIVGRASLHGELEPLDKCRGDKRVLQRLLEGMKENGFCGGKVRISHSYNEPLAQKAAQEIRALYPDCDLSICLNRGLCCYYAEEGGIMIGFEG